MRYLVLVFIYFLTINVGNSQYSVAIDRQRDAQCFPWAAGYNVTYKAYITLNPNSEEICEDIYIKVGSGITSEIVGPLIFVNSNRNSNPNGADCIGTLMESSFNVTLGFEPILCEFGQIEPEGKENRGYLVTFDFLQFSGFEYEQYDFNQPCFSECMVFVNYQHYDYVRLCCGRYNPGRSAQNLKESDLNFKFQNNILIVENPKFETFEIIVYDQIGRIKYFRKENENLNLNLNQIFPSKGIYILSFSGEGIYESFKFISN